MIGKLTGTLESTSGNTALLDVNGVGYVVQCAARTLRNLGEAGTRISLFIETQVREDAITLIGFGDLREKAAFQLLTTVQGVGAKVALSILSTLTPDQLADAVMQGDKTMLSSADGVGPKLAARLLTELKDKVLQLGGSPLVGHGSVHSTPAAGASLSATGLAGDAVSTLVNLGFRRDEAFSAVQNVLSTAPDADFDRLLKEALKDLAPAPRKSA